MNIYQAALLSIIEGVTEFLPISSTGHLVLAARLLAIPQTDFVKSFEIIIQLGAILAVVVLYRHILLRNLLIWKRILVAVLPAVIVGFSLYKAIKQFLLGNSTITVAALLIGGIILILLEKIYHERSNLKQIEQLSFQKAFIIGLFQSVAIIPGVSRAAATIIGGLYLGLNRKAAVEFSFLLAIPTMLAATFLDLIKSSFNYTQYESGLLALGFAGSFLTAAVSIKYFLGYIQQHTFILFGIYRIVLALAFGVFILG